LRASGDGDLQHKQGDRNGEDAVAERFKALRPYPPSARWRMVVRYVAHCLFGAPSRASVWDLYFIPYPIAHEKLIPWWRERQRSYK